MTTRNISFDSSSGALAVKSSMSLGSRRTSSISSATSLSCVKPSRTTGPPPGESFGTNSEITGRLPLPGRLRHISLEHMVDQADQIEM